MKQGRSEWGYPGSKSWVGRRLSDIDRFAFWAYCIESLFGDYGIMDASEQEQDQNLYSSMKALCSIMGDKGLGQELGTVSVDGKAFRVMPRSCWH